MGTHGLRVFKFRGRYWIFYNHYDSYLEGMGDSLVRTIPINTDGYQKWLLAQREFFNKWNTVLETMLCIQPEQLLKIDAEGFSGLPWHEAFDERMDEEPTHDPGSLDEDIDFMYLIDLDLEVFSIDHCAHYRLDKIPQEGEWMRAIFEDDEGHRFVHPRLASPESLADLTIANSGFSNNALSMWDLLVKREVKPKSPCRSVISRIRWKIFDIFQSTQKDQLSVNLLGWSANSLAFREIVFFILCVAAGGKNLAVVDERRILEPYNRELYLAMISGCKPDGGRELVSSIGVGYHMHDQPVGSSPNASKYWFEGVLVCLVPRLDQPGVLQKGLADAIQHGRGESPHTTFNGLLVSIEHLVLFRSFHNGKVEYSPLMSLITVGFHRSMNAQQRYGSEWLGDFDTRKPGDESGIHEENLECPGESSSSQVIDDDENSCKAAATRGLPPESLQKLNKKDQSKSSFSTDDRSDGRKGSKFEEIEPFEGHMGTDGFAQGLKPQHGQVREVKVFESRKEAVDVVYPVDHNWATTTHSLPDGHCTKEDLASQMRSTTSDVQGLPDSVELKAHSGPTCHLDNDNVAGTDARNTDHENGLEELEAPVRKVRRHKRKWTVRNTFLSLVNFFESTALDQLKPTGDNGGKLPIEIISMILSAVSDMETYNACREVSRGFRTICDHRPLLMDDVALRQHPIDFPAKVKGMNTNPSKKNSGFHALEISTGRPMEFNVIFGSGHAGETGCQIVVGSECNRKSFAAHCPINFAGLDLSAPWENTAPLENEPPWIDRTRYVEPPDEPISAIWDRALRVRPITANSTSQTLGKFWETTTRPLFGELRTNGLRPNMEQAWLMPPNTRQYIASSGGFFHAAFFHLLYVRLKRASKYWDTLWEDLIREAKESLEGEDESMEFKREASEQKCRLLGADNPFVMLIVGLEVRLFRWEHAAEELVHGAERKEPSLSGALTEFEPGRTYMFDDAADREAIERFLHMVAEKLKTVPPRVRLEARGS